jgi:hypothetical protein
MFIEERKVERMRVGGVVLVHTPVSSPVVAAHIREWLQETADRIFGKSSDGEKKSQGDGSDGGL